MGKLRRLSAANLMSALALFVALGTGGAYAANELGKNDVKSKNIANGQVKNADLATDAVTSPKVANGSLLGEDFAAGQLPQGPKGEQGPQGEQGVQGPAQPRVTQFGTTTESFCNDDDQNGDACAAVSVDLARPSSLHITADGNWLNASYDGPGDDDVNQVRGVCRLELDGVAIPGTTQNNGETRASAGAVSVHRVTGLGTGTLGLTGFRASVPEGAHTVRVFCFQNDGDIDWSNVHLAVTAAPLP